MAGPRTAKAIADAVLAQLPDTLITTVRGAASFDAFKAASELPKVVLASAKSKATPLYKSLSLRFKGRLAFAAVRAEGQPVQQCPVVHRAAPAYTSTSDARAGWPKRRSKTQTLRSWRHWACQRSQR